MPAPRAAASFRMAERRPDTSRVTNGEVDRIGAGERSVLTAVAQYPDGATREQLTILTGYKRSTRDAYLQRLATKGFVANGGVGIRILGAGMAVLGEDFEPLPTGDALREYWLARLPEGERAMLSHLIDAYPSPVDRETLSEVTGYKRSTRDAYLQRLGTRRLVDARNGAPVASAVLFE